MTQTLNAFSAAPEGFDALLGVERYLAASWLDHRLMALVNTRVSQINGCVYGLQLLAQEARELGESEARLYLLDAWRESALYSDRERAALGWAESLTNIATTRAPPTSTARRGATSRRRRRPTCRSRSP